MKKYIISFAFTMVATTIAMVFFNKTWQDGYWVGLINMAVWCNTLAYFNLRESQKENQLK